MRGWLVVNHFVRAPKFSEIYQLLIDAFRDRGVELAIRTNAELLSILDGGTGRDVDFILFWDKDILLARHLENLGYRLFNSATSIETCDDKGLCAVRLEGKGIRMPKTATSPLTYPSLGYPSLDFLDRIVDELGFPMVVKENRGSFGKQVYLVKSRTELDDLVRQLVPGRMIFQEYISASFGRDLRIQTVGDEIIASVMRIGKEGDFRANVTNGGHMITYEPSQAARRLALNVARELKLDFAGIDILLGESDEPILCEVNSNAHFKNLMDATGINIACHLADHVKRVMTGDDH